MRALVTLWGAALAALLCWHAASAQSPGEAARRALVLGPGGSTGRAWQIGLLKGLRDAGIDLTQADLVVGTSAGAIVGTQLRSGRALDELYEEALSPPRLGPPIPIDQEYYRETSRLLGSAENTPALRAQVGQRALAASQVIPEGPALRRLDITLGPVQDWPDAALKITAVDALDGTVRVFDKTQEVPIRLAVAASIAIPGWYAPITIGERRYMDGGVAGTHVDQAADYDMVVAILPLPSRLTSRETSTVQARGGQVLEFVPEPGALGSNVMDRTLMGAAAQAGLRQAAAVAAQLQGRW